MLGGGIIGLSIAWRLSGAGASVAVLDDAPASGATRAAAGMLAPVTEAHYGEEDLAALNLASASCWPGFAEELEAVSGQPCGYLDTGTLSVALDPSDMAVLEELGSFQHSLGLVSERLAGSATRSLEPMLSPSIRGGLYVPGDHQVDPRLVAKGLLEACRRAGAVVVPARVSSVITRREHFSGVRTSAGETIEASAGVLALGWRSGAVAGLSPETVPPVRPVKGQILRLRLPGHLPLPQRTVRAVVRGSSVYVVARTSREIVCGATVEERGEDTSVTAGAVYSMLRDAQLVLPLLAEAELVESAAGLRPVSPDNRPLVGPSNLEGLFVATGHYRNGVLLAPLTAALATEWVLSGRGELVSRWAALDPRRFSGVPA